MVSRKAYGICNPLTVTFASCAWPARHVHMAGGDQGRATSGQFRASVRQSLPRRFAPLGGRAWALAACQNLASSRIFLSPKSRLEIDRFNAETIQKRTKTDQNLSKTEPKSACRSFKINGLVKQKEADKIR